jgi:hypothetical protein
MEAYKAMAGIPIVGPALGAIAAAAAVASGAAQIAVAKQQRDEAKGLKSGGYSDEYVEGYYVYAKWCNKHFIHSHNNDNIYEIDPTTISIHHEDMLASDTDRYLPNGEKDLRIFASLEEFGKGGDIVTDGEYDFVVIFNGRSFNLMFVKDNTFIKFNGWENLIKFTKKGIQK